MQEILDTIDHKLLYALEKNARSSISEIARECNVSKQVAGYRLSKLENNVIKSYFTILDVTKLGYAIQKAFLKLQNTTAREEKALINYLKNHPDVVWLVSCDGQFDLAFGMRFNSFEDYAQKLSELDSKFGHLILERKIAPIVTGHFFYRTYLTGNAHKDREYAFGSTPAKAKLDDIDWQLIVELSKNCRVSTIALAHTVGLTPDGIRKRIKRLEESGTIKNYTIVLNNSTIDQQHFKILVKLKDSTNQNYEAVNEYCNSNPNIFYAVKTFGEWELEIDLEVPNSEKFREVMRDLKNKFSGIIRDYSYVNIYEIHKYNFCPAKPVNVND